jgi:hypothetical protein
MSDIVVEKNGYFVKTNVVITREDFYSALKEACEKIGASVKQHGGPISAGIGGPVHFKLELEVVVDSDEVEEPTIVDSYHEHEVVDRLHIACCFMDDHLLDHPFVLANPDLKQKLDCISRSLGEAYQDASNIGMENADIVTAERDALLAMTRSLDEHPEGYEGPCECKTCMSYATDDGNE